MSFGRTMTKEEYDREEHGVLWWIGRVILLILVIGTFAILLWRLLSSIVPKEISTYIPTENAKAAYAAALAEGKEPDIFWNELDTITRADHCRGYFACPKALFNSDCSEVQVIFRYNNSTIRHLAEDYDLPSIPSRDEELYDVTLVAVYDLTPDDDTDNFGNDPNSVRMVRLHPTESKPMQKSLYNYRRLVFEGFDPNDPLLLAVYVDVFYKDDIRYDDGSEAYGTLIIYDYTQPRQAYKLTKADREALGG